MDFLGESLEQLSAITRASHNELIGPVALDVWKKHLNPANPLWGVIEARPFVVDDGDGSAHVIAMVDPRLPGMGLVGYFGCTDITAGAQVLQQATGWLRTEHGIRDVYGPINGTITADYRLNLDDDYRIPGEPVNPTWYVDAFQEAGFKTFNRYVSGLSRRYRLFAKLVVRQPAKEFAHLSLRPSDAGAELKDLKIYHELMNAIFPANSIYCPVISWEERAYNMSGKSPVFDPRYTYFLEDEGTAVGFVVAYAYQNQLILKTLGLLPAYRGKHLSGPLLGKVHDQASEDGLEAAVYSTIRVGNSAYKMKKPGVKLYRRYVTMHKKSE